MAHPTDCLCISCAPISLPTRSPSVNDALAKGIGVELTQALSMFQQLSTRRQHQTVAMMACGLRMEGKLG
jgi:hypothetical protein